MVLRGVGGSVLGWTGIVGMLAAGLLAVWVWLIVAGRLAVLGDYPGSDVRFYLAATQRWLSGDGFYTPHQLAGPYEIGEQYEVLFPPTMIPLFVPFLVLPLALWWIIPLGATAWCVWRARPSRLAWTAMLLAMAFPNTVALLVAGNPIIWGLPALAFASRWYWPAAFLVLKPTVFPLAVFWVRHRAWWLGLGAVGALSLLFWPLLGQYMTVLLNARSSRVGASSMLHSLGDIPMLLIPVVANLGSGHPERTTTKRSTDRAGRGASDAG